LLGLALVQEPLHLIAALELSCYSHPLPGEGAPALDLSLP
jgi:hypothetical protein